MTILSWENTGSLTDDYTANAFINCKISVCSSVSVLMIICMYNFRQ